MAIDNMQGKVTTTGMMDKGPVMPKGKVNPKLPTQKKEQPAKQQVVQNKPMTLKDQFPNASQTELDIAERLKTLTDDDMAAIQNVLSPSVAGAFGKIVPELAPIFEQYRTRRTKSCNADVSCSKLCNETIWCYRSKTGCCSFNRRYIWWNATTDGNTTNKCAT